MDYLICPFDSSQHYPGFLDLIRSEGGEWEEHLDSSYLKALEGSITYVAVAGHQICGYVRAMSDFGHYIWVIDLLVGNPFRGNGIGRVLLSTVKESGNGQEVYVMSDADGYYEKQGYKKAGSIFKLE